eukprot:sb/3471395/
MSKRTCPGTSPNLENRTFKKHKIDNSDLRPTSKHTRIPSTIWNRQNQNQNHSRVSFKTVVDSSDKKLPGSDHKTPESDHKTSKRNRVVYIGNLSSPDRSTLLNLLRFYGPVRKLWLAKCGTFGFVWFSSSTDANMAKTRLNGAKRYNCCTSKSIQKNLKVVYSIFSTVHPPKSCAELFCAFITC